MQPACFMMLYTTLLEWERCGRGCAYLADSGVQHAQQEKHLSFILNAEHRTHVKDLASLHQIVQVRTRASDMHLLLLLGINGRLLVHQTQGGTAPSAIRCFRHISPHT